MKFCGPSNSLLRPSNSLRTGNLTGNFSGCGPFGRFSCPIDQINQRLAPKFPETLGTGNFFAGNREFSRHNRELFDGTGNPSTLTGFMETIGIFRSWSTHPTASSPGQESRRSAPCFIGQKARMARAVRRARPEIGCVHGPDDSWRAQPAPARRAVQAGKNPPH